MTETFVHLFGGWKKADARRWVNPDGTQGGIVAIDATLDPTLIVPGDATIWPKAFIGYGASIGYRASIGGEAFIGDRASIGYGASIGGGDWWLSGGPCGSRNAFWTVVYSAEHGLRWWIGCATGISTAKFAQMIQETHGDNANAQDYRAVIAFVEAHPGLARAKALTP